MSDAGTCDLWRRGFRSRAGDERLDHSELSVQQSFIKV